MTKDNQVRQVEANVSKEKGTKSKVRRVRREPKLQRREKEAEKKIRVTTYLLLENHEKLQEVKEIYNISITETINTALRDYFTKYKI